MYGRTNPNVCFIWPTIGIGIDKDGRYFFEVAWLFFAIGIGGE